MNEKISQTGGDEDQPGEEKRAPSDLRPPSLSPDVEQEIRLGSDGSPLADDPPKWRMHAIVEPPAGTGPGAQEDLGNGDAQAA